jgi:hypothetical protein
VGYAINRKVFIPLDINAKHCWKKTYQSSKADRKVFKDPCREPPTRSSGTRSLAPAPKAYLPARDQTENKMQIRKTKVTTIPELDTTNRPSRPEQFLARRLAISRHQSFILSFPQEQRQCWM